jgi:hypothetical protein
MSVRTVLNAIAFCGLAAYLLFAGISFPTFVEPSLQGTSPWRVYADSDQYRVVADYIEDQQSSDALIGLLALSHNSLLPALLALVLKTDAGIAMFNVILFLFSLLILARVSPQFKWYIFLPVLLAGPLTYMALLTLNKEVFVFFCAVLIARWFQSRSWASMAFLLVVSLLLRWEQALVLFVFLLLLKLRVKPWPAVIALVAGISIIYPFVMPLVVVSDVREKSSSAFFAQINVLQSYGLYFVLLVPKLVITLTSQLVRFWLPFVNSDRLHDLPTGPFVIPDQLCACYVLIESWRRKLWVVENPVIYFALVYLVIFIAAPENSLRYLYLLFVLILSLICSPELQALRLKHEELSPTLSRIGNNIGSFGSAQAR